MLQSMSSQRLGHELPTEQQQEQQQIMQDVESYGRNLQSILVMMENHWKDLSGRGP